MNEVPIETIKESVIVDKQLIDFILNKLKELDERQDANSKLNLLGFELSSNVNIEKLLKSSNHFLKIIERFYTLKNKLKIYKVNEINADISEDYIG